MLTPAASSSVHPRKWSGRRSSGCARGSRMRSKPPFFEQERRDSCALACLRMLLAQHGANVSEADLLQDVAPLIGGLPLEELVQLAQRHGFHAEVRQLDEGQLAE